MATICLRIKSGQILVLIHIVLVTKIEILNLLPDYSCMFYVWPRADSTDDVIRSHRSHLKRAVDG